MSNQRLYAVRRRSIWPFVAGLAAVAVIAAAVWALASRSGSADAPPPTAAPSVASPGTGELADGCLGRDAASPGEAVLQAQAEAPLTGDGAAAFMAAVVRWGTVLPGAPGELDTVGPRIMSADFPDDLLRSIQDEIRALPEVPQTATFVGKHYEVRALNGPDATVAFTVDFVQDGAIREQAIVVAKVVVEDGKWHWAGYDQAAIDAVSADRGTAARTALDSSGLPFEEAC